NQFKVCNNTVSTNPNTGNVDANTQPPAVQRTISVVIDKPRSLSITDPKGGYPDNVNGCQWHAPTIAGDEGHYEPAIDVPLDQNQTPGTAGAAVDASGNWRFSDAELTTNTHSPPTRSETDFRRVHLQRLANPLAPWNEHANPYLTVDSMSVPLAKFNGIND